MVDRDAESSVELVLDNRKLLVVFFVFIVICGIFFVLGFREGKRQGIQQGEQIAAESARETNPVDAKAVPPKEDSGEQPLNWYQSVNRKDGAPEIPRQTTAGQANDSGLAANSASTSQKQANVSNSDSTIYSVQVGAFRMKSEVETKAKEMRTKGYDCRIEEPKSPGGLYLLKIGSYKSRAEAVAMRLRLKNSGIHSIIKTN